MGRVLTYVQNIAVAYDEFWNTVFGGNPHETISRRASRADREGQTFQTPSRAWGCVLCKFLDIFQKDHCRKAEVIYVPPIPDIESK